MANTISFTPKSDDAYFTVAEVNAMFASIKALLDAKLDVRGTTILGDILVRSGSVINIPVPAASGDLLSVEDA